jgi:hypothetical protein
MDVPAFQPALPSKLTVSVFANPLYVGVAVFVVTLLLLLWRIPANRPVSVSRKQHAAVALVIASVATLLSYMSHTGQSINEVFDTEPAAF